MIRYALACHEGHAFESWFANSATYDRQVKRGLVSCPVCDSTKVEKTIMAPRVAGTKRRGDASMSAPVTQRPASSEPSAPEVLPQATQANVPVPVAMISPQEHEFRKKLKHLANNAAHRNGFINIVAVENLKVARLHHIHKVPWLAFVEQSFAWCQGYDFCVATEQA
jgi:hypothetical protein